VGQDFFSVLDDLSGLNPPTFDFGANRPLRSFKTKSDIEELEYGWFGSWSTDEFYKKSFRNGMRVQLIYLYFSKLRPFSNVYDWYVDNEVSGAYSNGCKTLLVFPGVPAEIPTNEYATLMAADPATTPRAWWVQQGHVLTLDERAGHMAWPANSTNIVMVSPQTNLVYDLAQRMANRYGDKVEFIEFKNEASGVVQSDFLLDWVARPTYSAWKAIAPGTKFFLNVTSAADDYARSFFDAGGTNFADGFSCHPYGTVTIRPIPKKISTTTGIKRIKEYASIAQQYGKSFGESELFLDTLRYDWALVQRALLDFSHGCLFSTPLPAITFMHNLVGQQNGWRHSPTMRAGASVAAINAIYRILEGGMPLEPIDKGDKVLAGAFQCDKQGVGRRYVVALAAFEGDDAAVLEGDFASVSDLKIYDLYGNEVDRTTYGNRIVVGVDAVYLESASSNALFNAVANASVSWCPLLASPTDQVSLERWRLEVPHYGSALRARRPLPFSLFATRVSAPVTTYSGSPSPSSESGLVCQVDDAGVLAIDPANVPGTGNYLRLAAVFATVRQVEEFLKLACAENLSATIYLNGQKIWDNVMLSKDNYRFHDKSFPINTDRGLSLLEIFLSPADSLGNDLFLATTESNRNIPFSLTPSFPPVEDTYIVTQGAETSLVHGNEISLNFSDKMIAFLKFDLRRLAGTVKKATLRLNCSYSRNTGSLHIGSVAENGWSEESLTFANAPAGLFAGQQITPDCPSVPDVMYFDLTSLITNPAIYSLSVESTYRFYNTFDSKESDMRPLLEIELENLEHFVEPIRIECTRASSDQLLLNWSSPTGRLYRVTSTTNLLSTEAWRFEQEISADTTEDIEFLVSPETNGFSNCFYRIELLLEP